MSYPSYDFSLLPAQISSLLNSETGHSFQGYRVVCFHPTKPIRLVMALDEDSNPVPRHSLVIDNENHVISSGDFIWLVCVDKTWNCVPKFRLGDGEFLSVSKLSVEEAEEAVSFVKARKDKFPVWIGDAADLADAMVRDYFGTFGHFEERPSKPYYWLKVFLNLVGKKLSVKR